MNKEIFAAPSALKILFDEGCIPLKSISKRKIRNCSTTTTKVRIFSYASSSTLVSH